MACQFKKFVVVHWAFLQCYHMPILLLLQACFRNETFSTPFLLFFRIIGGLTDHFSFGILNLSSTSHGNLSGISSITQKRSSHFLNGIIIGAVTTMALALVAILGFLWICLLSRKGRFTRNYVKVDKDLVQDAGKLYILCRCISPIIPQNVKT